MNELKAANLWQRMDVDMHMDTDMKMLGSRNKGRKVHKSPAIDLFRNQLDMSLVQPMP